jgi:ADA HAT complex component 1
MGPSKSAGNGPPPLFLAPWGVTDGPYIRHYARWLLPHSRFYPGELEPATPLAPGTPDNPLMEGRSRRGNLAMVVAGLANIASYDSRKQ